MKRSGLPYQNFHTIRHTTATWLYEKTGDLRLVKDILGHSNISTTLKYSHLVDKKKEEGLNKLFG